jgi:TonB family protein
MNIEPTSTLPARWLPVALLRRALMFGVAACLTLGLFVGLAKTITPRSRLPVIPRLEPRFPPLRLLAPQCLDCGPWVLPIHVEYPGSEIEVDRFDPVTPDFRDDLRWSEGPRPTPIRLELGRNFMCVPLRRSEPEYPASARRRRIEGQVVVDVAIDPRGHVSNATMLQAEPAGVFEAAALRALRSWRYPASSCDRTQVRLRFELGF